MENIKNEKGMGRKMKIAVTYEDGNIYQHFGHTEKFKIYELNQENKVISSEIIDTNGSGHGALAGFLSEHGVNALICGGIGGGARMALEEVGIELFGGVTGSADDAVEAWTNQSLAYQPDIECTHHHDGGGEHSCGERSCGEHGRGDCHK